MNRFEEAFERIKKNVEIQDCWKKEDFEHYNIVVEALKKQIPKKVIPFKRTAHDFQSNICKHSGYSCEHIKTFNNEYQYADYKCPICKKRVSDGTPKHCDKCGQALEWDSEEGGAAE